MANIIEATRGYLSSVAKRTVGVSAWQEAMQRPASSPYTYESNYKWARPLNQAFDKGAVIDSLMQIVSPVTARYLIPSIANPENPRGKLDYVLIPAAMVAVFAADAAIFTTVVFSTHNPVEFTIAKLGANCATQVGLDLAEATINRVRNFRSPTSVVAL